ncbi:MAG: hypothetical protein M1118_09625 [Chloroflexi bacterium]|nr:hypothetical protein [Chloroflexota bacterium]
MSVEHASKITPRMQSALTELEGMIREHYPTAQFRINPSQDDPEIIHLTTTVDVEDTEDVLNLVIDRMMEMQIEEGLPIFVIPVRPRERILAQITRHQGPSPRHLPPGPERIPPSVSPRVTQP